MVNGYINNYPQIQASQLQAKPAQPAQPSDSQQPNQTGVTAPIQQTIGTPSNPSAVSINIISPSVYGQNQAPIPYAPIYSYPQAQTPPPPPVQATATATATANATPPAAPVPPAKPPVKKDIVPLTDEYIKTLENYMNDDNEQVRVQGIKQVMNRFKDDDSRKRDAALTALLNKGLQDKSSNVRFLAMTTVAAGYAAGDDKTAQLLQELQKDPGNYNEDGLFASKALVKMAEQSQKVDVTEQQ